MQAITVLQLTLCIPIIIISINITGEGVGPKEAHPPPTHLFLNIIIAELLQTSCIVVSSSCTPALWSRRGQLELAAVLLLCE